MEDGSFDPRTWVDQRDGVALERRPAGDTGIAYQSGPVAFPLTSAAALRLWLASFAVLGLAAGLAWSMSGRADGMVRIELPPAQAAATAAH